MILIFHCLIYRYCKYRYCITNFCSNFHGQSSVFHVALISEVTILNISKITVMQLFLFVFIRCTYLLPAFFPKIWGFILKKWLPIYDSMHCPSLATTFSTFLAIVGYHFEKNKKTFEAIHESIHCLTSSTERKCWWARPCAIDRNKW